MLSKQIYSKIIWWECKHTSCGGIWKWNCEDSTEFNRRNCFFNSGICSGANCICSGASFCFDYFEGFNAAVAILFNVDNLWYPPRAISSDLNYRIRLSGSTIQCEREALAFHISGTFFSRFLSNFVFCKFSVVILCKINRKWWFFFFKVGHGKVNYRSSIYVKVL